MIENNDEKIRILKKYFSYVPDKKWLIYHKPGGGDKFYSTNCLISVMRLHELWQVFKKPPYWQPFTAMICKMLYTGIADTAGYVHLDIQSQGLHPNNLVSRKERGFVRSVPEVEHKKTRRRIFHLDESRRVYDIATRCVAEIINEALQEDIICDHAKIKRLLEMHKDTRDILFTALRTNKLVNTPLKLRCHYQNTLQN